MPFAEYIWIDGTTPTAKVRNKTKYTPAVEATPSDWGFDGSSTSQASGHDSDCVLRPVRSVDNPLRPSIDGHPNTLVLCEVFMPDGVTPHPSNTRARLRAALEAGASKFDPMFGIEQEYTLMRDGRLLGWPDAGYPRPQGPYYCGVGADDVAGRDIVEAHAEACVRAGLMYEGSNAEVLLGQWEFQVGAGDPLTVADHLWLARWLLYRIGEDHGVYATLHPKPMLGDWNGTGAHTNFSTAAMRATGLEVFAGQLPLFPSDTRIGMDAITDACEALSRRHAEHIAVYGADNHLRLTGHHETCDINTFRCGVADRGASIRIPRHVANKGRGYLEDRRPAANADPYLVCERILRTVCLGE
ncbi:MAG: glutamine synthetase [Actinobacteria bacterium]|nr:glutamine synthetase [Actinomycetota bacterium]NBR66122.1 glutamine synthetase [Actinomycetota bacterium]